MEVLVELEDGKSQKILMNYNQYRSDEYKSWTADPRYRSTTITRPNQQSNLDIDNNSKKFWHWDDLLDLYVLGEQCDVPYLQLDIIKLWESQTDEFPEHCCASTVRAAHELLPDTSNLCNLISWCWAYRWKPQITDDDFLLDQHTPRIFLGRVLSWQARVPGLQRGILAPQQNTHCTFHRHIDEKESKVCLRDNKSKHSISTSSRPKSAKKSRYEDN